MTNKTQNHPELDHARENQGGRKRFRRALNRADRRATKHNLRGAY